MANLYNDFATDQPEAVSPLRWLQPFEGDTVSTIIEQDYEQDADDFERLALDQSHPDYPDHYLVSESDPRDIGGGIFRWTRTWAKIPEPREESETYIYTVPGLATLGTFASVGISSAIQSGSNTTITTASAHGFTTGDEVVIQYTVTFPNGSQAARQVYRIALAGTTGSTLIVPQVVDNGTIYWPGAIVFPPPGREAYNIVVPSTIQFDYFLPGVSTGISEPGDIQVIQRWEIIGSDGSRTDTLSATTAPTATQYRAMVAAQTRIVAEPSSVRRWRGNIYERVTRYVTAV